VCVLACECVCECVRECVLQCVVVSGSELHYVVVSCSELQ